MVVPDDQLLLVPPRLLPPQRDHPLLVADEHDRALGQLRVRVGVRHALANFVDVLLAIAGSVTTLKVLEIKNIFRKKCKFYFGVHTDNRKLGQKRHKNWILYFLRGNLEFESFQQKVSKSCLIKFVQEGAKMCLIHSNFLV